MPGKAAKALVASTGKGKNKAKAVHGVSTDGQNHVVLFDNLHVAITNDDGGWFAQALQIDYATQGSSLEDVKRRFEEGLLATVTEHLRLFGSIDKLLTFAPQEVWHDVMGAAKSNKTYSQLSVHQLPFKQIEYVELQAA